MHLCADADLNLFQLLLNSLAAGATLWAAVSWFRSASDKLSRTRAAELNRSAAFVTGISAFASASALAMQPLEDLLSKLLHPIETSTKIFITLIIDVVVGLIIAKAAGGVPAIWASLWKQSTTPMTNDEFLEHVAVLPELNISGVSYVSLYTRVWTAGDVSVKLVPDTASGLITFTLSPLEEQTTQSPLPLDPAKESEIKRAAKEILRGLKLDKPSGH